MLEPAVFAPWVTQRRADWTSRRGLHFPPALCFFVRVRDREPVRPAPLLRRVPGRAVEARLGLLGPGGDWFQRRRRPGGMPAPPTQRPHTHVGELCELRRLVQSVCLGVACEANAAGSNTGMSAISDGMPVFMPAAFASHATCKQTDWTGRRSLHFPPALWFFVRVRGRKHVRPAPYLQKKCRQGQGWPTWPGGS